MNQRLIGGILMVIVLVLGLSLFLFLENMRLAQQKLGCVPSEQCEEVESIIGWTHFFIGIVSAIFALGFYMALFSKGEEAILRRIEEEKQAKLGEEKFSILLKGLDEFEKKVAVAVSEQQGITQQTLRFRTHLSKAKLSQVLQKLESKKLIYREKDKKTYRIYLSDL